jgi:hypothetical protein
MKILFKTLIILSLYILNLNASNHNVKNSVDCIIIKDENSIICKYIHNRINYDKKVIFKWIEPNKILSRQRVLDIPLGHGSVYDFRYINGRAKGQWTLEVIDDNKTYKTNFIIE